MPDENNTTNVQQSDPLDELVKKVRSAKQSSPELDNAINVAIGLFLEQKDEGHVEIDHQKELEDLLIAPDSPLEAQLKDRIRTAQDNYYNGKAQCNPEGSESSKKIEADPVMMFNGQYLHTAQDIKINGAGMDFVFSRTYKNQTYYNGPLGFNWDHNYNLWLRVEGDTVVRSSGELREDRYIKHKDYDYYAPPAGYHDIIDPNGNSFVLRTPNGTRFLYEQIYATNIHRIKRIEDRNGNYLSFRYDNDGRLQVIEVNHKDRKVEFHYDERNRIDQIKTYEVTYKKKSGNIKVMRVWRYAYDDFGDLVAVTTPQTDRYPEGLTIRYEYSSSSFTGELMHNLLWITDPAGQLYLENEFGTQKGLLSYNRVVRQRQGNGGYHFEYEDIIPEQSWDYAPEEIPAHRTIFYQRNFHAVEHIYNKFGNLIVKKEKILRGCEVKEFVSRYRYNKDGALIGSLSPEGSIVQYYYGREDFYKRPVNPGDSSLEQWQDQKLTKEERLRFGNLLAVVKRGKYYNLSQMNLNRGVYGDFFPSILASDPEDIITKYTYEPDYQQVTSISDLRYTQSADPRHSEVTNPASDYNRHLTVYEYSNLPAKNLIRIKYPNTTFPSPLSTGDTGLTDIKEEYLQYDSRGRVEKINDPEGDISEYKYFKGTPPDEIKEGYLHKEIRGVGTLNLTTENEVNEAGLITATINPKQFRTEFIANELDQTIETVSPGPGFKTKYFFDRNNLLERRERDNFDGNGNPSPDGPEVATYKYDAQNNLLKETIGGADLSQHHVTQHFYNSSDKRIKTVLPRGNTIRYEYEETLLLNAVIRAACSPLASITKTIYDGNGRKGMVIDGRHNVTSFKYDPFDRLIATVDALGNIQQTEYDKLGNITIVRFFEKRADGKYYLLSRRMYEYDERGSKIRDISYLFKEPVLTADIGKKPDHEFVTAQNQGLVTPVEMQYFYDKKKRLFRLLNAKGQETTYEYDAVDRKIKDIDNLGNYSITTYDENSNIDRIDRYEIIRDPQTGVILREEVFSTINEYDELDRKIATVDGLGNRTEFQYDSRNNLVKVKDALGNVKRYQYDIFNRKIAEIVEMTETGLGGGTRFPDIKTQFDYDKNNNLISITDAREAVTRYDYDALDRLIRTTYHTDPSFRELKYDANDNVVVSKDNNGLRTLYTYDVLNRKFRVSLDKIWVDPRYPYPADADDFEKYEYDGLGRPLLQKNNFCEIKSKFDSLNRAYQEEIGFTTTYSPPSGIFVLSRSFDIVSNRTGILYPRGREIQYDYDSLNRLKRILNKKKGRGYPGSSKFPSNYEIAKYEYGGLRLFKTLYGNQAGYQLFYDGLGRIISTQHNGVGGSQLLEIQQLYDGAGNKRLEINIPVPSTGTTGEVYKYDSLYRLTKFESKNIAPVNPVTYKPSNSPLPVARLNGQQAINSAIGLLAQNPTDYTYKYDSLGNRVEERQAGQSPLVYVPNVLNQYERRDGQNFQYDLNGNLIDDRTRKYFYNYRNQLIRVQDRATNNDLINVAYDAIGRSIAIKESANVIYLANDGLNVIEEYSGTNIVGQYVYENGIDRRCQLVNDSEEFWYHCDLILSTRLLTNSSGQVLLGGNYDYDPFGNLLISPSQYNPYLFAGKRLMNSVGLYDSRARSYSPAIGRFLQRDPKGFVDGPNVYTYGENNPVGFIDLLGTEKQQTVGIQGQTPTFRYGRLLDEPPYSHGLSFDPFGQKASDFGAEGNMSEEEVSGPDEVTLPFEYGTSAERALKYYRRLQNIELDYAHSSVLSPTISDKLKHHGNAFGYGLSAVPPSLLYYTEYVNLLLEKLGDLPDWLVYGTPPLPPLLPLRGTLPYMSRLGKFIKGLRIRRLTREVTRFVFEERRTFKLGGEFRKRWVTTWSSEHMIIKQRMYRGANPIFPRGTLANRMLQGFGDAGWNQLPMPLGWNQWLDRHRAISAIFNYGFYPAAVAAEYGVIRGAEKVGELLDEELKFGSGAAGD